MGCVSGPCDLTCRWMKRGVELWLVKKEQYVLELEHNHEID